MNVKLHEFQEKALEELQKSFGKLWEKEDRPTELLLKAPTGAGKTLISVSFIDSLQTESPYLPIIGDVAFIWITFSDELAMQSKDKFISYFAPNLRNKLTTVEDLGDSLSSNEILFINWQKVTQAKGVERLKLRRPGDIIKYKESGVYFEDVIENTKAQGKEIIVIIDESHTHADTFNSQTVMDIISPKLIFKMSATPFRNDSEKVAFEAKCYREKASLIEIDRQDVVDAGLIKEEIVCQTEEDLRRYENEDIDKVMLDLAIERRLQIKNEWARLKKNINPLCMIQLPNDDRNLNDNEETKEQFTINYLKRRGIQESKIAIWLDNKPIKAEWRLCDDDSDIEFLIFKVAAGTGWDCPRAHVLVMFREIQSPVFQAQTLGRIVRMACQNKELLEDYPILRTGYLYTTYTRNQVSVAVGESKNRPKVTTSKIADDIKKSLGVETAAHEIGTIFSNPGAYKEKLQDVVDSFIPERRGEEIRLPSVEPDKVEEIKGIVKNVLEEQFDKLSEAENTFGFESEESEKENRPSEEKIGAVAYKAKQAVIEGIINAVGTENVTPEVKHVVENIVQGQIETQAGKRECELIIDSALKSDYISRTDYGDLGKSSVFQKFFINGMNDYFHLHEDETLESSDREILQSYNIDLSPEYKKEIMVEESFQAEEEYNTVGENRTIKRDISDNEATHSFTIACMKLLQESRIGNVARSWSVLKSALLQWFNNLDIETVLPFPSWYRIFVKDIDKDANSTFRAAISKVIADYEPTRQRFNEEKRKEAEENMSKPFRVRTEVSYDDTYERYIPSSKCIQTGFCLKKEYRGRDNETRFIDFLENNSGVNKWFKNPDSGKDSYCISYYNSVTAKREGFHPDWIVLYHNGDIGIFDTKQGITGYAQSQETRDKLNALSEKIRELNSTSSKHYIGGIYELRGGTWQLRENTSQEN